MRRDNTHMDHFEDRIVLAKKNPIHWIDDICNDKVTWSRKWDGAPSIFVGRDEQGIYVAKKGIFNKNPKLYHTDDDIRNDLGDSPLADKLFVVLLTLKDCDLEIGDLVQGDLLFTRGDITNTKDGRSQFQANTIVYQADGILNSEWVGIVWHTRYIDTQAHYGHDIKSMIGENCHGLYHFNADDEIDPLDEDTKTLLSYMKKEYNRVKTDFSLNQMTVDLYVTYINSRIKEGTFSHDGNITDFANFVVGRMNCAVDSAKREDTKQKRMDLYGPVYDDLHKMVGVDKMHSILYKMKMVILKSLNKSSSIDTYLKTKTGLRPTSHEGYVAINAHGIDAVKIVDRQEFSFANFSPEVIKGWTKD